MSSFLETNDKSDCCGCGACSQACGKSCIIMKYDEDGFIYPNVDKKLCISCGRCVSVCPFYKDNSSIHNADDKQKAYGGYVKDENIRAKSTSGGGFTAVVNAFCDNNYAIFGAEIDSEFNVYHSCVYDKKDIDKFRGSKYTQSEIRDSYEKTKNLLRAGRKVLFSGTPCQIAGLYSFLGGDKDNLFTIDLVCHGVPSPKLFHKEREHLERKYGSKIEAVNFRSKDNGHWDNGYLKWIFKSGRIKKYWDEPFMSFWLNGFVFRSTCLKCPYASLNRVGDITLADLWGVHHFAPDLYGENRGTSFFACNSEKGRQLFEKCKNELFYREINIHDAAKYNNSLSQSSKKHEKSDEFMADMDKLEFRELCKKYMPGKRVLFMMADKLFSRKMKCMLGKTYAAINVVLKGKR